MDGSGFYKGNLLLPKTNLPQWSVIACDQFTSQPEYWREVEEIIADAPSTYHMIFPEVYLGKVDFDQKIAAINQTMEQYWKDNIFQEHPACLIYTERTLQDGTVRKGVVGLLDLEQYDYSKGSTSLVRATEGTILERLPPRVKIRENALLESPHIIILIDDEKKEIIEPLHGRASQLQKLYDFDLMMDGGNVKGYLLTDAEERAISQQLSHLAEPDVFGKKYGVSGMAPLVFAVGDGNHSLATAKVCYEEIKKKISPEEALCHPARYALVELNNLHDDSLEFEPIHRAVFDVDEEDFLKELRTFCDSRQGDYPQQDFTVVTESKEIPFTILHPERTLTIGSVQEFLTAYCEKHGGEVDYIHGDDVVRQLASKGAVGILLPCMEKSELFQTVIMEGALPRKTFSMGEAKGKRYYLECRKIK